MKKKLCCYCGIEPATTKDHIPPKSIFNKPRPKDLITVPCCEKCNSHASVFDEKFKIYLGMHTAFSGGEAEILFKDGVLRSVKHNKKIRDKIFQTQYPVLITSPAGIILGKGVAVPWDNEAHDTTIERIVRGLFFFHYKQIIPTYISIKTYWFRKLPLFDTNNMYGNSIANGNFSYWYNKVDNTDFDSVWFFSFYNAHFAGGIILSDKPPV